MSARHLLLLRCRAGAVATRWRCCMQRQAPNATPFFSDMSGTGTLSCPAAAAAAARHGDFWLLSRRTLATVRAVSADSYLLKVLKSEIEHEHEEEANNKDSLKGSAGPFELSDKPGMEEIVLKRSFGKEQIVLTCVMECKYPEGSEEAEENQENEEENQENEEENEEEEQKPVETLQFNVTITKDAPMPAVELECSYERGASEISIESVGFLTEDSFEVAEDDEGCNKYEGPIFSGLDENVQRAFHDLLKARGITPKVATYALDYLSKKEHREYMRWLQNIRSFFKSDKPTG